MIKNGKDTPLGQSYGKLPRMEIGLKEWLIPMVFTRVTKTTINFKLTETFENIDFMGVWQPLSSTQISRKPEGQRSWRWYKVHSETSLSLNNDDIVIYLGEKYRVGANEDYKIYGYYTYDLCEDFT